MALEGTVAGNYNFGANSGSGGTVVEVKSSSLGTETGSSDLDKVSTGRSSSVGNADESRGESLGGDSLESGGETVSEVDLDIRAGSSFDTGKSEDSFGGRDRNNGLEVAIDVKLDTSEVAGGEVGAGQSQLVSVSCSVEGVSQASDGGNRGGVAEDAVSVGACSFFGGLQESENLSIASDVSNVGDSADNRVRRGRDNIAVVVTNLDGVVLGVGTESTTRDGDFSATEVRASQGSDKGHFSLDSQSESLVVDTSLEHVSEQDVVVSADGATELDDETFVSGVDFLDVEVLGDGSISIVDEHGCEVSAANHLSAETSFEIDSQVGLKDGGNVRGGKIDSERHGHDLLDGQSGGVGNIVDGHSESHGVSVNGDRLLSLADDGDIGGADDVADGSISHNDRVERLVEGEVGSCDGQDLSSKEVNIGGGLNSGHGKRHSDGDKRGIVGDQTEFVSDIDGPVAGSGQVLEGAVNLGAGGGADNTVDTSEGNQEVGSGKDSSGDHNICAGEGLSFNEESRGGVSVVTVHVDAKCITALDFDEDLRRLSGGRHELQGKGFEHDVLTVGSNLGDGLGDGSLSNKGVEGVILDRAKTNLGLDANEIDREGNTVFSVLVVRGRSDSDLLSHEGNVPVDVSLDSFGPVAVFCRNRVLSNTIGIGAAYNEVSRERSGREDATHGGSGDNGGGSVDGDRRNGRGRGLVDSLQDLDGVDSLDNVGCDIGHHVVDIVSQLGDFDV